MTFPVHDIKLPERQEWNGLEASKNVFLFHYYVEDMSQLYF